MNWDDFKENVENWAEERGIYEHSTPQAQLLKALSELGELADAVIKNDREGLADAIGDVAVCLVNYAKLAGVGEIYAGRDIDDIASGATQSVEKMVGSISTSIGDILKGLTPYSTYMCTRLSIDNLENIAEKYQLSFLDCLSQAWHEIKDRQGKMTPGGAFVKLA